MSKTEGVARRTVQSESPVEYMVLAQEIKRLREKANLSQVQLSIKIGRPKGYLWKVESGSQLPDFAAILAIIKATGGDAGTVVSHVVAESERLTA